MLYEMINATEALGACALVYPYEPWKCLYGQYRTPLILAPYMLTQSQFDSFQLSFSLGAPAPYDPNTTIGASQIAYIDDFQARFSSHPFLESIVTL